MQTAMETEEKQLGEGKYDHLKVSEDFSVECRPNPEGRGGWDINICIKNQGYTAYLHLDRAIEAYLNQFDSLEHWTAFQAIPLDVLRDKLVKEIRNKILPDWARTED